jgi:hypothetical protein
MRQNTMWILTRFPLKVCQTVKWTGLLTRKTNLYRASALVNVECFAFSCCLGMKTACTFNPCVMQHVDALLDSKNHPKCRLYYHQLLDWLPKLSWWNSATGIFYTRGCWPRFQGKKKCAYKLNLKPSFDQNPQICEIHPYIFLVSVVL